MAYVKWHLTYIRKTSGQVQWKCCFLHNFDWTPKSIVKKSFGQTTHTLKPRQEESREDENWIGYSCDNGTTFCNGKKHGHQPLS